MGRGLTTHQLRSHVKAGHLPPPEPAQGRRERRARPTRDWEEYAGLEDKA